MQRVRTHDDPSAFAALVRRWQGPVQRLCARMIGDSHRAEDLAQEAFVRLFARRKEYEPVARFSTFIRRIALNLFYDELRRRKRRPECSLDDALEETGGVGDRLAASDPPPDAVLAARERADRVREALLCLPEPYRAVVVLRHYEGLKFREIAEVLEIPEGTVKSRMAEALDRLARQRPLGEEREAPDSARREKQAKLTERTNP